MQTRPRLVLERGGLLLEAALDELEPTPLGRINETETVGFHIASPEPAVEYRLLIGTEPAGGDDETAIGVAVGEMVQWPAEAYFESARGPTPVRVQSRQEGTPWNARGGVLIDTVPGKLGETRYRALHDELRAISASLVRDVHGKSMRAHALPEGEAIGAAWRRAEVALAAIARTLDPALAGRSPRRRTRRSIALRLVLDPSLQPEHRVLAAALDELTARIARIVRATDRAIEEMDAQRGSTDVAVRGRSLYQLRDAPRRERLNSLQDVLHGLQARILTVRTGPPFAGIAAGPPPAVTPMTSPTQRRALRALRTVLAVVRDAEAGGSYLKATSRLYEEWLFLRLAGVLARNARSPSPLRELIARIDEARYGAGLARATTLRFDLFDGRTAVLRFEPWVRTRPEARDHGDEICREDIAAAPLTPDLLLFLHSGSDVRATVIDAKYTSALKPVVWQRAERYFALRRTDTGRRIDTGVWLAAPIPVSGTADRSAVQPPHGWRGGFLPLVPGTAEPEPLLPGDGAVVSARSAPRDAGVGAADVRSDGPEITLRAFLRFVLGVA